MAKGSLKSLMVIGLIALSSGCATVNINIGAPAVFNKGQVPREAKQFFKTKKDIIPICIVNCYDKNIDYGESLESLFRGYVENVRQSYIERGADARKYYYFEIESVKDSLGVPEDFEDDKIMLTMYEWIRGTGYILKENK